MFVYEYVESIERFAYVKREALERFQALEGRQPRKMVWQVWSWSDNNDVAGPWEDYRWIPCGLI